VPNDTYQEVASPVPGSQTSHYAMPMIALFRKIRLSLLSEHKTGNYVKYALGEIVLVVIGILIALQINNWNENRKDRLAESAYLQELLEDFEINLSRSRKVVSRLEEVIPRLIGVLEQSALEEPTMPVDSLNSDFILIQSMPAYTSTDRTYNNLIGSGDFRLITRPELKTAIASYYEGLELLNLVQASHEMELVNSFQPYIIESLDFQAVFLQRLDDITVPPPIEKDRILSVLKDRKFRNIITLKVTILTDLLQQNRFIEALNGEVVRIVKESISDHDQN